MKQEQIPIYSAAGVSLGFRTREAAERLVAGGHVKPAYGRKGHLRAVFLPREDGSDPVGTHPRDGTRYSFLSHLDTGHRCWKLRRLDGRDEDGTPVDMRTAFFRVLGDCLVARGDGAPTGAGAASASSAVSSSDGQRRHPRPDPAGAEQGHMADRLRQRSERLRPEMPRSMRRAYPVAIQSPSGPVWALPAAGRGSARFRYRPVAKEVVRWWS